jgi:hypothetical protein
VCLGECTYLLLLFFSFPCYLEFVLYTLERHRWPPSCRWGKHPLGGASRSRGSLPSPEIAHHQWNGYRHRVITEPPAGGDPAFSVFTRTRPLCLCMAK